MNLATLDRYLLFLLDAIRQGGVTLSSMWQQEERLQALNNGYSEVAKLIRRNRRDHFTRTRLSTDGVVNIRGIDYDTAGLQIRPGVATYTLPPDLLEIRAITPQDPARSQVTFVITDAADEEYRNRRRTTLTTPAQPGLYFCAVTGERTITLAPTPQETLDVQYAYVAQLEPLRLYSTGTVTATNGVTSLQLDQGANWLERVSGIRTGDELIVGTTAAAAVTASTNNATITTRYHKIGTVAAAGTDAGLMDAYLGTTTGQLRYTVASVPQFHDDWHYAVAHWAVMELIKSIELGAEQAQAAATAKWQAVSGALIPESAQRQSQNVDVAEDGWSAFE